MKKDTRHFNYCSARGCLRTKCFGFIVCWQCLRRIINTVECYTP